MKTLATLSQSLLIIWLLTACGEENSQQETRQLSREDLVQQTSHIPPFSSDSAYRFIEEQLAFGPRVPNTEAHKECAGYLAEKLRQFTPHVSKQRARVTAYDGTTLNIYNIEAQFYPEHEERILLCAHWDTRHVADQEYEEDKKHKPIPGANDGASGVAVILEIARHLAEHDPGVGVDVVFFDAEDYGVPHFKRHEYGIHNDESWALGAQYWSRNLPADRNLPQKGILLDMVGAQDARFLKEGYSMQYASEFVKHVWRTADGLGYSDFFLNRRTIPITDDHYYVNTIAGIPTINIIDHDPNRRPHGFTESWHTHRDDIEVISKETLSAVGETVLGVLFEK